MTVNTFISYSNNDKASYSSLCLALDNTGVLRWDVTKLDIGQSLAEGLRIAIKECSICVFLATKSSLKSKWCLAELGAFWGAGKKVIIYLADPEVDESELPPQFRGNLWTSDARELVSTIKKTEINKVQKTSNKLQCYLGTMKIKVSLGKIQDFDCTSNDCLVALPANEYFDDECIHDSRSALGAFMQHHFNTSISDIQALVKDALENEACEEVNKKPTETGISYGVGKSLFLNNPLSSNLRIAMVAVTTQRAGEGLRADASYIFKAAKSLQQLMVNNRLATLYIPILGSGHGGLKQEISLVCMLIAFGELHKSSGHNLKEVNIIVYRHDSESPPSIPEKNIMESLEFAKRFITE